MILLYLSTNQIRKTMRVSRQFRAVIRESTMLLQKLFLAPKPNQMAWLVEYPLVEPKGRKRSDLDHYFGTDARALRFVSCGNEAQGQLLRVVRLNEQLSNPSSFWENACGRRIGRRHPVGSEVSVTPLNGFVRNAPAPVLPCLPPWIRI